MDRQHRYQGIGIVVALVLLLAVPANAQPTATGARAQVGSGAASWLAQAAPDATATFIVGLHDTGAQREVDRAGTIGDKLMRRERVNQLLSERAGRNDAALRGFLRDGRLDGEISAIQAFKSFNGFSLTANKRAITALQRWERVSSIELEEIIQLESLRTAVPLGQINAVEWNIARIGVDRVQNELGINGSGVVVGGLDTGVHS